MSKLWMVPAAALCGLLLVVACSEDDDGGTVTPETADAVGTWTGQANYGQISFLVMATFTADSMAGVDAYLPATDSTQQVPVYHGVGGYTVKLNKVIVTGDTCIAYFPSYEVLTCSSDTLTVTGTTMAAVISVPPVTIPVTLVKQTP